SDMRSASRTATRSARSCTASGARTTARATSARTGARCGRRTMWARRAQRAWTLKTSPRYAVFTLADSLARRRSKPIPLGTMSQRTNRLAPTIRSRSARVYAFLSSVCRKMKRVSIAFNGDNCMSRTSAAMSSSVASFRRSRIDASPPGFSTRWISLSAPIGSVKFLKAAMQTTKSKEASANGMSDALPWRASTSTPALAAFSRVSATKDRLMSSAVTIRPDCAIWTARYPGPGATSRTRPPGGVRSATVRAAAWNLRMSRAVFFAYQVAIAPSIGSPLYGLSDANISHLLLTLLAYRQRRCRVNPALIASSRHEHRPVPERGAAEAPAARPGRDRRRGARAAGRSRPRRADDAPPRGAAGREGRLAVPARARQRRAARPARRRNQRTDSVRARNGRPARTADRGRLERPARPPRSPRRGARRRDDATGGAAAAAAHRIDPEDSARRRVQPARRRARRVPLQQLRDRVRRRRSAIRRLRAPRRPEEALRAGARALQIAAARSVPDGRRARRSPDRGRFRSPLSVRPRHVAARTRTARPHAVIRYPSVADAFSSGR